LTPEVTGSRIDGDEDEWRRNAKIRGKA